MAECSTLATGLRSRHAQRFRCVSSVCHFTDLYNCDKELAWLNRAQRLGLGRVDTNAMRIEADVYVVSVGERKRGE